MSVSRIRIGNNCNAMKVITEIKRANKKLFLNAKNPLQTKKLNENHYLGNKIT